MVEFKDDVTLGEKQASVSIVNDTFRKSRPQSEELLDWLLLIGYSDRRAIGSSAVFLLGMVIWALAEFLPLPPHQHS